jgi:uncharacterized membrane protein YozB (DUF420 family)
MANAHPPKLPRVLILLTGLLILRVTGAIVLGYVNYFPANFDSEFLGGREGYFFGAYQWAFYTHIAAGPVSLLLGMILVGDRFRMRFPRWHRILGRVQAGNVLLLVAPSGLWMAWFTSTGPIAGMGFACLAVLTGTCVALGWRAAILRRFPVHRRWMWRCFLLLCSAVVLRLAAGLGTVLGVQSPWFDPVVSWGSWLVPLAAYELTVRRWGLGRRIRANVIPTSAANSPH